jgi:hypothetical protein
MANGWTDFRANVAAVSSLTLSANRFVARTASIYGVGEQSVRDADHLRGLIRVEKPDADPIALSLSYALAIADAAMGNRAPWKERLPREAQWFMQSSLNSLFAVREALSDPLLADHFKTSVSQCRSGLLAADLKLPASLSMAIAALRAWTDTLAIQSQTAIFPTRERYLDEAIDLAGGVPCAVYSKGNIGFPVIVTNYNPVTSEARGFPTIGFKASDLWIRRSSWLRETLLPEAQSQAWTGLAADPDVIAAAIEDFETRALPEFRRASPGRYMGSKAIAEHIGVSVPRLAAWMRREGFIVKGGDGWIPDPLLDHETVQPRRDAMDRLYYVWSPEFVSSLVPQVADIASATITRGPSKPPAPASEKQLVLLRKLFEGRADQFPDHGFTKKEAAAAIDAMIEENAPQRRLM